VVKPGVQPKEVTVVDNSYVKFGNGTRYVLFNQGQDSLQDERQGSLDPDAINLSDNNCTQPNVAPCLTLGHALAQAQDGDTIKLAAGSYSQTVVLTKSLTIQGGHDENNWPADPPDHLTYPTIFAPTAGRAFHIKPGQSVTLDRLVIQNGDASGLGGGPNGEDVGGNIFNEGTSLTVSTSRIHNGKAALGGGLYSIAGELILRNNLLHDNNLGAVRINGGKAYVENNSFYRNIGSQGAALYAQDGTALTARNNIFSQNGSGGRENQHLRGEEHTSQVGEEARAVGAIFATSGTFDYNLYHGDSVAGGATAGQNQVTADPQFTKADGAVPNLKPLQTSPAIDKGDPTTNVGKMPYDYGNQPRRSGLIPRIDIGAYEFYVKPPFEFVFDNDVVVPLGSQYFITHTLKNTSNATDTYTLQKTSTHNWSTMESDPIIVGPGQTKQVVVIVTVPADVAIGTQDVTVITATSQNTAGAYGFVIDATTAGAVQIKLTVVSPTSGYTDLPYSFIAKVSPSNVQQPIAYTWQATDQTTVVHSGGDLDDEVQFTWATVGNKDITVTADNGLTKATFQFTIVIAENPTVPMNLSIKGATYGLISRPYQFEATAGPADTMVYPITYYWTADGQTVYSETVRSLTNTVIFTWPTVGWYTIRLTATNAQAMATTSFVISMTDKVLPPLELSLVGITAGVINEQYVFSATTTPDTTTQMLTYRWEASGQPAIKEVRQNTLINPDGLLKDAAIFSWPTAGAQVITVTVSNEAGSVFATHHVTITNEPVTPKSVVITGPVAGETNQNYNFIAQVSEPDTTQPLTYRWTATDQQTKVQTNFLQDTVSFRWLTAGVKVISVSVTNQTNQPVVAGHQFVVKVGSGKLYLPVLLKQTGGVSTATPVPPTATPTTGPSTTTPPTTEPPTATPPTATPTTGLPTTEPPTATPTTGLPTTQPPTATPTSVPPTAAPTSTPVPNLPDLVIDVFTITDLGNNQYQAVVTVRNQGLASVPVGNNFYVAIYVDDVNLDPPIFWGVQGAWFGSGQSRTLTKDFTAADVGSGPHTFHAWVDPWNYVGESNEDNNRREVAGQTITGASEPRERSSTGPMPTPTMEH
jgi:hypothetical protein